MSYFEFNTPASQRATVKPSREIHTEYAANRAILKTSKVKQS
jgi:hypothetical protein